jgi:AP endonuclease-2
VLCPPGSSTAYRDLPEDASIGGYPTPAQVASLGIDPASLDAEGRCLVLEFPAFVLFGVYSPANSNGLRDDFRYGFLTALDTRIRNLAKMGKRVVLTGDLNVSREEMDTAKAEEHMRQEGITREDYLNAPNRRVFNQLLENGKVPGERDEGREHPVLWDTCREFHPTREGMYTHWEQKINARPGNFGSRIDFVLCSIEMKTWFADANIQEGLMGSDHCPVYALTKPVVDCRGKQVHMADIMNPSGMFEEGVRLRDFSPAKDLLPLSGKLLPEFDRRRTIKDMFKKTVAPSAGAASMANSQRTTPTMPPGPLKSPEKRRASGTPALKPLKKAKSSSGASGSQTSLAKGQQSLKGFFAPKATIHTGESIASTPPGSAPKLDDLESASAATSGPANPSATSPSVTESFLDPQATKESWVKLFSKKPPPRCEGHDEPCTILTTKKPGVNCGRQFWICAR